MKIEQACRFRTDDSGYRICSRSPGFTTEADTAFSEIFNDVMNPLFNMKMGKGMITCAISGSNVFFTKSTLRTDRLHRLSIFSHVYLLPAEEYRTATEQDPASFLTLHVEDMQTSQSGSPDMEPLDWEPVPHAMDLASLREKYKLDDTRYATLLLYAYHALTGGTSLALQTKNINEAPTMVREIAYCVLQGLLPVLRSRLTYSSLYDARMTLCTELPGYPSIGSASYHFRVDDSTDNAGVSNETELAPFLAIASGTEEERAALLAEMQADIAQLTGDPTAVPFSAVLPGYYLNGSRRPVDRDLPVLLNQILSLTKHSGVDQTVLDEKLTLLLNQMNALGRCPRNILPTLLTRMVHQQNAALTEAVIASLALASVEDRVALAVQNLEEPYSEELAQGLTLLLQSVPASDTSLQAISDRLLDWMLSNKAQPLASLCASLVDCWDAPPMLQRLYALLDSAQGRALEPLEASLLAQLLNRLVVNVPGAAVPTFPDDLHWKMLGRHYREYRTDPLHLVYGGSLVRRLAYARTVDAQLSLLQSMQEDFIEEPGLFYSPLIEYLKSAKGRSLFPSLAESYQAALDLREIHSQEALIRLCAQNGSFLVPDGPYTKQVSLLWSRMVRQALEDAQHAVEATSSADIMPLVTVYAQNKQLLDRLEQVLPVEVANPLCRELHRAATEDLWGLFTFRQVICCHDKLEKLRLTDQPILTSPLDLKRAALLDCVAAVYADYTDVNAFVRLLVNNSARMDSAELTEIRGELLWVVQDLLHHGFLSWDLLLLHCYVSSDKGSGYDCRRCVALLENERSVPANLDAPLDASVLLADATLSKAMLKAAKHKKVPVLQQLVKALEARNQKPGVKEFISGLSGLFSGGKFGGNPREGSEPSPQNDSFSGIADIAQVDDDTSDTFSEDRPAGLQDFDEHPTDFPAPDSPADSHFGSFFPGTYPKDSLPGQAEAIEETHLHGRQDPGAGTAEKVNDE